MAPESEIVRMTGVAVACPAVRLGDEGLKTQEDAPVGGNPLQASVTEPDRVLLGSRVKLTLAVSVVLRFKVACDSALMVKSGGVVTLSVVVVICDNPEEVPVIVIEELPTGVVGAVWIVTPTLAVCPGFKVATGSEKLQEASAGSPEHAKETFIAPEMAVEAVTLKLVVAAPPAGVLALAAAPSVNGLTELKLTGNRWVTRWGSPPTATILKSKVFAVESPIVTVNVVAPGVSVGGLAMQVEGREPLTGWQEREIEEL